MSNYANTFYIKSILDDSVNINAYYKILVNNGHLKTLLLNENIQTENYFTPLLNTNALFYTIWSLIKIENELLNKKLITLEHPFFQNTIKFMEKQNPDLQQKFYILCKFISFEYSDIASHWNFESLINTSKFHQAICKELSQGTQKSLQILLKYIPLSELELVEYTSDSFPHKPPLNLKTKTIKDIINTFGNSRVKYVKLFNELEQKFSHTYNIESLIEYLNLNNIHEYELKHVPISELKNKQVMHKINNQEMLVSIEQIANYNSMCKSLTGSINYSHKYIDAYGLQGKKFNNFETLIYHFAENDFLRKVLPDFMLEKANKAIKPENKAIWRFYALQLKMPEDSVLPSKTSKNKI